MTQPNLPPAHDPEPKPEQPPVQDPDPKPTPHQPTPNDPHSPPLPKTPIEDPRIFSICYDPRSWITSLS